MWSSVAQRVVMFRAASHWPERPLQCTLSITLHLAQWGLRVLNISHVRLGTSPQWQASLARLYVFQGFFFLSTQPTHGRTCRLQRIHHFQLYPLPPFLVQSPICWSLDSFFFPIFFFSTFLQKHTTKSSTHAGVIFSLFWGLQLSRNIGLPHAWATPWWMFMLCDRFLQVNVIYQASMTN